MLRYRYVLHETACTALLTLEDGQISRLIAGFETLASHPLAPADSYSMDEKGRPF